MVYALGFGLRLDMGLGMGLSMRAYHRSRDDHGDVTERWVRHGHSNDFPNHNFIKYPMLMLYTFMSHAQPHSRPCPASFPAPFQPYSSPIPNSTHHPSPIPLPHSVSSSTRLGLLNLAPTSDPISSSIISLTSSTIPSDILSPFLSPIPILVPSLAPTQPHSHVRSNSQPHPQLPFLAAYRA